MSRSKELIRPDSCPRDLWMQFGHEQRAWAVREAEDLKAKEALAKRIEANKARIGYVEPKEDGLQ